MNFKLRFYNLITVSLILFISISDNILGKSVELSTSAVFSTVVDDDFNDGDYTDIWIKKEGTWQVIDGGLCLTEPIRDDRDDKNSLMYLNYVYKPNVGKNLRMTAKVTPLEYEDNYWSGMGIFVHGSPEDVEEYHKWALCFRFKKEKGKYKLALLEEWEGVGWAYEQDHQMGSEYKLAVSTGVSYWFKMEVIDREVWGKAWKVGEPEPEKWSVTAVFSEYNVDDTAVGLFSHDFKVKFDDVKVEIIPPGYSHKGKKLDRTLSEIAESMGFSMSNLVVGTISTYFSELTLNETLIGFEYSQKPMPSRSLSYRIIGGATPSLLNSFYDSNPKFKPKYVTGIRLSRFFKGNSAVSLSGLYFSNTNQTDTTRNNLLLGSDFDLRILRGLTLSGEFAMNDENYTDSPTFDANAMAAESDIKYRLREAVFGIRYRRINPGFNLLLGIIQPDLEQWDYSWIQRIHRKLLQNSVLILNRNNLNNHLETTTKTRIPFVEWFWQITRRVRLNFGLRQEGIEKEDNTLKQITNSYITGSYLTMGKMNFGTNLEYRTQESNIDLRHFLYVFGTYLQYEFNIYDMPVFFVVSYSRTDDYLETGQKAALDQTTGFTLNMIISKEFSFSYTYKLNIFDSSLPSLDSYRKDEFRFVGNYFFRIWKKKNRYFAGSFELN